MTDRKGQCLCGKVSYVVSGDVFTVECHCDQCRHWTGHFAVLVVVPRSRVTVTGEEHITWFRETPDSIANRGSCKICGSSIFDDRGTNLLISAGTMESPTGIKIGKQVCLKEKGDYY